MFNVVPIATMMETMIYMALRAILGVSTTSCRLCNSIEGSTGSSRLCNCTYSLMFMYIGIL
eukprot:6188597-Pleurochrysis_carterae.AAC.1